MAEKYLYREEKLKPPVWDPDKQNFNEWKFLVELWDQACTRSKLSKPDRSYSLFAKLKDVDKKGVGSLLVSAAQLGTIDVFGDNGVQEILDVLDTRFKQDQLSLKKKAWQSFVSLKRHEDDDVDKFLDNFDQACANLKLSGRDLDDETFALQLLQSANLDEETSKLVVTGIDEEKPDIFGQTKKAMRKYLGSENTGLSTGRGRSNNREDILCSEDANFTSGGSFRGQQSTQSRSEYHGGNNQWRGNRNSSWNGNRGRSNSSRGNRGSNRGNRGKSNGGQRRDSSDSGDQSNNQSGIQRQLNPRDKSGKIITCNVCGSIRHLAGRDGSNCPDSFRNLQNVLSSENDMLEEKYEEGEEEDEEAHKSELETLEVLKMIQSDECLLDTCCTSNVMGRSWKEKFIEHLPKLDQEEVELMPTQSRFRFGGDDPVPAIERIKFPCYILGKRTSMIADVVDRDIPLLMLSIEGAEHKLNTTSNGHLKLPLWNQEECNISFDEMDDKEKVHTLHLLQRQFRHQPASVTADILKSANVITPHIEKLNKDVAENCDTCNKYKRNKPRPVVAAPLSKNFNDVIAMDLKILLHQKLYIIYFIDLFTRFIKGCTLKRKTPDVVVESFITTWIASGFGSPRKVLVDNGGEFDNALYLEAMEQYGIEVCATGAHSPWSNGVCERNHHVVDLMIMKMLEEEPRMKVALANAVTAKKLPL